jgi:quercetin dioxygenase-like cupin family protein
MRLAIWKSFVLLAGMRQTMLATGEKASISHCGFLKAKQQETHMPILNGRQLGFGIVALGLFAAEAASTVALEATTRVTPLLSTGKTIMDEPIVYPTGAPAKVTTAIVEMQPGAETGWHTHGVPLTGLILDGELTVDYGVKGKRTYKKGYSVAEAMSVPHNGKNTGNGVMRLFVVYMGADGIPTSIPAKQP